jgi:ABC-type uncharacterized transport system substrate-binding protein
MKNLIKDLWLAVSLILGASAILLLSDLEQRQGGQDKKPGSILLQDTPDAVPGENGSAGQEKRTPIDFAELAGQGISPSADMIEKADLFLHVAQKNGRPARLSIITLVENPLLEDAERGLEAGLKWSGLEPGEDYVIKKYSAQGEIGQLPQIIDAVLSEKPDVVMTVTTPAMVAVVNKVTGIPVVFTVASDPFKLNLFKNGRPGNVCGVHDNPALDLLLDMVKEYDARISAVGIVYDASQVNSVLSVEKLREAGRGKNIKILEATASSVTDLGMATQALLQRGAQAIIISADNLAATGFSSIYHAAETAGIPIFTTEPQLVEQGATGAIGDSYFDWGEQSGKMAARIIAGVPVSHIPITGTEVKTRIDPKSNDSKAVSQKPLKIRLVHYSETAFAERCHEGMIDGINKAGLVEGRDYELRVFNAQGDMSTLSSIMTNIKSERADLLLVISTPALQAALRQAGSDTKIVFSGVADAVKAGAGKSETDHMPNVTGITTRSDFEGMASLVKETIPGVKNVGTLFTPAEVNSVFYKDLLKEALGKEGIGLVSTPVNSSADLAQAATDLCLHEIQALCQIADNVTRPGFALIARKAADQKLPVFVFDTDEFKDGATVCLARDYYDAGLEAAEKALRVLRGENPAMIPISNTQSERLLYDPELAERFKLRLTGSFLENAKIYTKDKIKN